jgi:DNA-binding HxlR family transcriptional regulator
MINDIGLILGCVILTIQIKEKTPPKIVSEHYLSLMNAPTELFNPYRLLIMQDLVGNRIVEYRQLKYSIPGITDGNLANNLKVLEQAGYLTVEKEVVERKIRTSYEVTEKGLSAFKQLKDALLYFFGEVKSCNE